MKYDPLQWPFVAAIILLMSVVCPPGVVAGWRVAPSLQLGVSQDANVYRTSRDEVSDTFLDPEIGLTFASSAETNRWSLSGGGFYSYRAYTRETDLNFNTFGEEIRFRYNGDGPGKIEFSQGFWQLGDVDRRPADSKSYSLEDIYSLSAQRDLLEVDAACEHRLSDKMEAALAYRYSSVDYEDPLSLDLRSHLVQTEVSYAMTDKTALFTDVQLGTQDQAQDGASADLVNGHLGLRTRSSDKLTGRAGLGLEHYGRSSITGDKTENAASFDLSMTWQATDKIALFAGAKNGNQLSSFLKDNGVAFIKSWAGLAYQAMPSTKLSLNGVYRRERYLDPIVEEDGTHDRRDQRFEAQARIDYQAPSGYWGLCLMAGQEHVASTLATEEYDHARLTVGARMDY